MEVHKTFSSLIMGVPPYAVGNKLRDMLDIKTYGLNKVISCCVPENVVPPTEVGCVRRCTLRMKCFEDALLREELVETYRDDNHTVVTMEYVPCAEPELHRSPFGPQGHSRLQSARTTYAVSAVSNSLNRCFVEATTTMTIQVNPHGDELEEKTIVAAIKYFWQTFLDNLMLSLESQVLSEAYPVLSGRLDSEFRRAYEAEEDAFCQWAASSAKSFPREDVLKHMEKALVCWSRVLQEYRHQKLIAETVKNDVESSRRIAAETAKQLADSTAMIEAMRLIEAKRAEAPPCLYNPPNDAAAQQVIMDRENRRLEHARNRRMYQTHSTTDPNPPIEEESTNPFIRSAVPNSDVPEPLVIAKEVPKHYHPNMLNSLFTTAGSLDEEEASLLFRCLDNKTRSFVTTADVQTILMPMDHQGLYEDVDGTQEALAQLRAAIQDCFASRYSTRGTADMHRQQVEADAYAARLNIPEPADSHLVTRACPNAIEKTLERHDAMRAERKAAAMAKLAEDTVGRFAFREGGKLYFDEFCLALMHLLRH